MSEDDLTLKVTLPFESSPLDEDSITIKGKDITNPVYVTKANQVAKVGPTSYVCEDCGFGMKLISAYHYPPFSLLQNGDEYLCPQCVTAFLQKHVKVMKNFGVVDE